MPMDIILAVLLSLLPYLVLPANLKWNSAIEHIKAEVEQELYLLQHDIQAFKEDPEVRLTTPEIVNYWGYPSEEHWVATEDHYVLGLHRIPHGKTNESSNNVNAGGRSSSRPVVLLQHGLLCSSSNWVTNLPHQSLGFVLADAGFDVWMGNNRGNKYSKNHTTLSTRSEEFWEFSWDEMAAHDLPAMVDYILEKTGRKQLHYVGHSQGSMILFAKSSTDADGSFTQKIRSFTALGPVTKIGHMKSNVFRYLAKISGPLHWIMEKLGKNEFLPNSFIIKTLAEFACETRLKFLCSNFLFLITGFDQDNLNTTRTPVYLTHTPAGTSVQNMHHFAQMSNGKEWRMYDWGKAKNRQMYGQDKPPAYQPKNINVPVYAFFGGKDIFTTLPDVNWLLARLPNLVESVFDPSMDHLGYIWGLNARERVYDKIIDYLSRLEAKSE